MVEERAIPAERTKLIERATSGESAIYCERAMRSESTKKQE